MPNFKKAVLSSCTIGNLDNPTCKKVLLLKSIYKKISRTINSIKTIIYDPWYSTPIKINYYILRHTLVCTCQSILHTHLCKSSIFADIFKNN